MLELRRVSKHFAGIPAVDDVSFSARPGEVTGYLGPNGSGKSTTMKMITGLLSLTAGQILFDRRRIDEDLIAFKRRMGYVPEEPYLYNHLALPVAHVMTLVPIGGVRSEPAIFLGNCAWLIRATAMKWWKVFWPRQVSAAISSDRTDRACAPNVNRLRLISRLRRARPIAFHPQKPSLLRYEF